MRLMVDGDYDGASVGAIAREAGLAQGLVHYHFDDKLDVLLVALEILRERWLEKIDLAVAHRRGEPARQLRAFLDLHLKPEHADRIARGCWMGISVLAMRDARVRVAYESALGDVVARLRAILERGRARGVFECPNALAAAQALMTAVQGFFLVTTAAPSALTRGAGAPAVRRMAAGLLGMRQPL